MAEKTRAGHLCPSFLHFGKAEIAAAVAACCGILVGTLMCYRVANQTANCPQTKKIIETASSRYFSLAARYPHGITAAAK